MGSPASGSDGSRLQVTVPDVAAAKRASGRPPLVMVTAYDACQARIADRAGVDLILVGDSVGMVCLGLEDTLGVTLEDMVHHVRAVARARPRALLVADMPWMSYHTSPEEAVANAAQLVRAGARAVKLEGGAKRLPAVEAILSAEIPVMGHLGLTPQSVHALGGFRVQAKELDQARRLAEDASALAAAGCFALVLEGVPDVVAGRVTEELAIPTIGIGAGQWCDGQVMVFHDLLGLEDKAAPKFVRRYAQLGAAATEAIARFAADVRQGRYPSDAESYHARDEVAASLIGLGGPPAPGEADTPGRHAGRR
ncbi:MAG TPA: 3-methyl-2-oxobutanoate hydroxymethyltransferase [Acidimicrobiales bacterium]|jgi:3-methyl-2-oxobutanoate hydroxymethyltransferase|nr:3-methyl-2-oxobutanoate hydroxymethyltransferase [Acidimicrobiales bacterium]